MLRMGRCNNNKVAKQLSIRSNILIGASMSCNQLYQRCHAKEFVLRSLLDTKKNITQSLFHDALESYKDIPNEFANSTGQEHVCCHRVSQHNDTCRIDAIPIRTHKLMIRIISLMPKIIDL
jgi:hypothetical protein